MIPAKQLKSLLDDSYSASLIEFNRAIHDKHYSGDRMELSILLGEMLLEMLENWLAATPSPELWNNRDVKDQGDVIFVYAFAETGDQMELLINRNGFHLSVEIQEPGNIPRMKDDFWLEWLRLASLGQLDIVEHDVPSAEDILRHPGLLSGAPSTVFRLAAMAITSPLLSGFPTDGGRWMISWPYEDYSIAEVMDNGRFAFERICWLNSCLRATQEKVN